MHTQSAERNAAESECQTSYDRLSAFFRVFDLSVSLDAKAAAPDDAKLVVGLTPGGHASRIVFYTRGPMEPEPWDADVVAASIKFGGAANPLVNALPDRVAMSLGDAPALRAIANAFVFEATEAQCGRDAALGRLAELIVLMILRQAIRAGATGPGLLAGLAHPALYRSLAAIHNDPARAWRIDDLAALAGMSRSRFMALFRETLGTTPGVYLTDWRLTLARRALSQGRRIKSIAARVGFGSAAALSRAYARKFGHAPSQERLAAEPGLAQHIIVPGRP